MAISLKSGEFAILDMSLGYPGAPRIRSSEINKGVYVAEMPEIATPKRRMKLESAFGVSGSLIMDEGSYEPTEFDLKLTGVGAGRDYGVVTTHALFDAFDEADWLPVVFYFDPGKVYWVIMTDPPKVETKFYYDGYTNISMTLTCLPFKTYIDELNIPNVGISPVMTSKTDKNSFYVDNVFRHEAYPDILLWPDVTNKVKLNMRVQNTDHELNMQEIQTINPVLIKTGERWCGLAESRDKFKMKPKEYITDLQQDLTNRVNMGFFENPRFYIPGKGHHGISLSGNYSKIMIKWNWRSLT